MAQPAAQITIRRSRPSDLDFFRSLSPVLAGVIDLGWHDAAIIRRFQDAYIEEMMAEADVPHITLIAEAGGAAIGFIHARERRDEISGEACATVPLLAVADEAQGLGAGRALVDAAGAWAKVQGFRLLHLEVFASNAGGRAFYGRLGFEPETINMIKPLG